MISLKKSRQRDFTTLLEDTVSFGGIEKEGNMRFVSTMYKNKITLEKTDFYCPNCGEQNIVREVGVGDFYQGAGYYCRECKTTHHLDSSNCDVSDEVSDMIDNMEEEKIVYKLTTVDLEDKEKIIVTGLTKRPNVGQTITRLDNKSFIVLKVEEV